MKWAVENQNFALKKSLSQCLESSVLFTASSWCFLGTVTSLMGVELGVGANLRLQQGQGRRGKALVACSGEFVTVKAIL